MHYFLPTKMLIGIYVVMAAFVPACEAFGAFEKGKQASMAVDTSTENVPAAVDACLTSAECQSAALALNLDYRSSSTSTTWTPGCYAYNDDSNAYRGMVFYGDHGDDQAKADTLTSPKYRLPTCVQQTPLQQAHSALLLEHTVLQKEHIQLKEEHSALQLQLMASAWRAPMAVAPMCCITPC